MNALKHGAYSAETEAMKRILALCRKQLKMLKNERARQKLAEIIATR